MCPAAEAATLARIILLEAESRLLSAFPDHMSDFARTALGALVLKYEREHRLRRLMASLDAGNGKTLQGFAPVAKQYDAYVGRLLRLRIENRPEPAPFRYRDFGTMAVIGLSRAVADFG